MRSTLILLFAIAAAFAAPAFGKPQRPFVIVNEDVGVPVFADDLADRPHVVIGEVRAGVRKGSSLGHDADQAKIYRELWERAEKMSADAVINARYGDAHVSAFSWGKTNATGTAIRFLPGASAKEAQ